MLCYFTNYSKGKGSLRLWHAAKANRRRARKDIRAQGIGGSRGAATFHVRARPEQIHQTRCGEVHQDQELKAFPGNCFLIRRFEE